MSVENFTQVFSNHFGTASAIPSILLVAAVVQLFVTYRLLGERSALAL
jgi:hypothetical protein